jgi:catechol 2,3-dioxygenase-like lactoylglutathione lyase family enzyme
MPSVVKIQHVSVPMPPGESSRARTFYGEFLGMEEKAPPASLAAQELVWFDAGDAQEIHVFADASMNHASSGQHVCLQVDSMSTFRSRAAAAGVTLEETTPIPNRPRCFVRDPFGNLIEVTEILGDYD